MIEYTPSTYYLEVISNGEWKVLAEFTDIRKLKNHAKKLKLKHYRVG